MVNVDRKICKKVCPFADKGNGGICALAVYHNKPREKVCVSHVSMKIEEKKEK
jgi:hypothetical protein